MPERDLDIVVFGATGVTGRHVASYLARRAEATGARWAPAGRDAAKLERVMREVGATPPETIVADLDDPGSLAAMAARARVVLNLVGPYTLYGRPVIEACIEAGAHYVDLTGEIQFVRRVIEDLDERARSAGVKVVEAAGFEALPPDLAVALADQTARERFGEGLAEVDLEVRAMPPSGFPRPSDALSGGTLQSLAAVASDDEAAIITDPAALVPDPVAAAAIRRISPIPIAPRRGSEGSVIAPMAPAAFINPAVIHRTAALFAAERGVPIEPICYREGVALSGRPATLPLRYAAAGALAATQGAIGSMARATPAVRRPLAAGLRRVLPASGFGPTGERMETWRWSMRVAGRTASDRSVMVEIDADGHPGYLSTARMIGEAGLILAEPGLTPERAGCLTPAVALGTAALDRFEHAGVRFSVR